MQKPAESPVPMVAKAMELLEVLSEHPEGLTVGQIVDRLNYPKATLYKTACTLRDKGYLGHDRTGHRFFLSRKLLQLGLCALDTQGLLERSLEHLCRLRDRTGESAMLGTLSGDEVVLLHQFPGTYDFVFTLRHGMRFNLYSTAPGKVMLAFGKPELLETLRLEPLNDRTLTDRDKLARRLGIIRRNGFALDVEETVRGVHCVAAPIFDMNGEAVACIWISGPSGRLPRIGLPAAGRIVAEHALAISYNLGYTR